MMLNKLNFEDRIKQELSVKAGEVEISDLMLPRIANRIKSDAGGSGSILKDKFQNIIMRKWIAVSLAAVLVIGAVMFTFSPEVRAETLNIIDTIKTIFVVEKSQGEYKIVKKTTEEPIFSPSICKATTLSDAELTSKMGFNITFPETLYGEYKLQDKAEGVGIRKNIVDRIYEQLSSDMLKAIDDDAAFSSLSQYDPYRDIFAIYNKKGSTIFIDLCSSDGPTPMEYGNISSVIETSVGDAKAVWIEVVFPDYKLIIENGVRKSDLYTEPNGISTSHFLTWDYNGVRYVTGTVHQSELTMEESVKVAKSFMAGQ
jgi:hypothetical protein